LPLGSSGPETATRCVSTERAHHLPGARWQDVSSSLPSFTRSVRASVCGEAPSFFTRVAGASGRACGMDRFGASQRPLSLLPRMEWRSNARLKTSDAVVRARCVMPASEPDVTARPLLFVQGDPSSQRTGRPRSLSTHTAARGTDNDERAPAPSLENMPTSSVPFGQESAVTTSQIQGLT